MCVCVCVYSNQCEHTNIFKKRTFARERDFVVSRAFSIPFSRQLSDVRVRLFLLRARGPTSASSLLLRLWTTFAVRFIIPSLPVRARPSCNPCQLVPPPRPIRPLPLPRERPTRDRYLRGSIAIHSGIHVSGVPFKVSGSLTYAGAFFIGSLFPQYPSH